LVSILPSSKILKVEMDTQFMATLPRLLRNILCGWFLSQNTPSINKSADEHKISVSTFSTLSEPRGNGWLLNGVYITSFMHVDILLRIIEL
jgi:hypothetical protein